MEKELLEGALYHGFRVLLTFADEKPTFGDLFLIRGFAHPLFPPTARFKFADLENLGFDQVDDYFGITAYEEEGDDVKVWLFPVVAEQHVYHHHGPFDGLELSYDVLRNQPEDARLFLRVVDEFARYLPVSIIYVLRNQDLGNPPNLGPLQQDIEAVITYWRTQGIEPGSPAAMQVRR